jgi:Rieske Fe-S protein
MTDLDDTATGSTADVTRRVVLRGATVSGLALPFLAACGGDETTGATSASPSESASSADAPSSDAPSGSGPGIPTSDVPVGGGTILKDEKVVLTQPTAGDFKAFTAVCTHQGCTVTKVEDGQIICPCHGSHFSIKDGAPVSGPAGSPLAARKVSVEGDHISLS